MNRTQVTAIVLAVGFVCFAIAAGVLADMGLSNVSLACGVVAGILLVAAIPTALDCVGGL